MKRLLALTLSLFLAISLVACAEQPISAPTPTPSAAAQAEPVPTPAPAEAVPNQAPVGAPSAPPTESPVWPRSLRDIQGNAFDLDKPVERIVSLSPSVTEILFAIGAGDMIVGADTWSDYPEAAQAIERVGDFSSPSVEKIVALDPDIVLCANTLQDEQIEVMRSMGLQVAVAEARTFVDVYSSIEFIGQLLPDALEQEASFLATGLRAREENVIVEASKLKKSPSVYYVMSMGDAGNWTSGHGSFINTMMETAGGTPITYDAGNAWIEFSLETLVERDPDILFVSSDFPAGDLMTAAGYSELTAVKNGNVFALDAAVSSRPGPRIFDALEQIAAAIRDWAK